MISNGFNYWHYNEDGSLDEDRTAEAFIDYLEALSEEDSGPLKLDDEKTHVYIILTTPSSAHWYEKPIAGAQGSYYSHTAFSFDKKMSTLYHVRSQGLLVSKRKEFEKETIAFDIYSYEVTLKEKRRLHMLIDKMRAMETKYDFLMIGKLLGKIILHKEDKEAEKMTEEAVLEKQKYICSGWVAGILAATVSSFRSFLRTHKKKWTRLMPQDFINVKGMTLKKRIVFPDNKTLIDFEKDT
jgi:hypothetical protein